MLPERLALVLRLAGERQEVRPPGRVIEEEAARPRARGGAAASQTTVSAPCSGVRRMARVTRWKTGSAVRTDGVSAQPGCIAFTTRDEAPSSGQIDVEVCGLEGEPVDHEPGAVVRCMRGPTSAAPLSCRCLHEPGPPGV